MATILAAASLLAPVPAKPSTVSVNAGYFAASRPQITAVQVLADRQPDQRAVLFLDDADPRHPQGLRLPGTVTWRTETVSPGSGTAPKLVVRADIKIPARHLAMTWSLRHNADDRIPASHLIEVMFHFPRHFFRGGISNLPGILMKESLDVRGAPLAALAIKVTDHSFLIDLNASDAEMRRNVELLKERTWFDILVVFRNGNRAIVSMEKGPAGEHAFADAFATWGN